MTAGGFESHEDWARAFSQASARLDALYGVETYEGRAMAFAEWKNKYPEAAAAWVATLRRSLRQRGYEI